ncbi:twin-arginine translocation signal domain-containing protein [Pseudoroseomonas cervicalis]|uniref:twin-arginine translocation signal domain-containing protein n=1 Tax=Teichococcus cervicalis TaxID=204525 RepID=UPI0022F1DC8C|nr:twin-arginine translocation signal domain-containing protein [Pseudoroseomonas cervicalis]WBV43385.1 twin-arginine translocation signal domain-containing protein [Pseudoroseomonas cervicalis]
MSNRDEGKVSERRGFLKALGLAGGAAAAAAAPAVAQTASQPRPRKETEAEKVAARYRETDHVKAFYRTNRY